MSREEAVKADVLGIGERIFDRLVTHERFGDVADEVCNKGLEHSTNRPSQELISHRLAGFRGPFSCRSSWESYIKSLKYR
jgi:hypothetical protein